MTESFIEHLHFAHLARVLAAAEGTLSSQVGGPNRSSVGSLSVDPDYD